MQLIKNIQKDFNICFTRYRVCNIINNIHNSWVNVLQYANSYILKLKKESDEASSLKSQLDSLKDSYEQKFQKEFRKKLKKQLPTKLHSEVELYKNKFNTLFSSYMNETNALREEISKLKVESYNQKSAFKGSDLEN